MFPAPLACLAAVFSSENHKKELQKNTQKILNAGKNSAYWIYRKKRR